MKKRLSLLLLLLVLLFSGCGAPSSPTTPEPPVRLPDGVGEPPSNCEVEFTLPTFETYRKYRKFLRKDPHAADILPYEQFAAIGDFAGLVILTNGNSKLKDYSKYMYTFRDKTGEEVVLYVSPESCAEAVDPEKLLSEDLWDPEDLRELKESVSGVILLEGLQYRYLSGGLLSVAWCMDGYSFVIAGDSMLRDQPMEGSAFFTGLFRAATATETVTALSK